MQPEQDHFVHILGITTAFSYDQWYSAVVFARTCGLTNDHILMITRNGGTPSMLYSIASIVFANAV